LQAAYISLPSLPDQIIYEAKSDRAPPSENDCTIISAGDVRAGFGVSPELITDVVSYRYDDIPSPAAVKAALLTKVLSRLRPERMQVRSYETHVTEARSVKYRDYHIHIVFYNKPLSLGQ